MSFENWKRMSFLRNKRAYNSTYFCIYTFKEKEIYKYFIANLFKVLPYLLNQTFKLGLIPNKHSNSNLIASKDCYKLTALSAYLIVNIQDTLCVCVCVCVCVCHVNISHTL